MASSKTQIANLAISNLGIGKEISDLDSDSSEEARACRRYYEEARDTVLRDFPWPFATKIATASLIEEDPVTEWNYSYRYPSDCLMIRKLLSGQRNDSRNSRVPYRIASDDSGRLFYTDLEDAEFEYTSRNESVEMYPSDFVVALSYRLAAYIAPRISGGDHINMHERMMGMYMQEISNAQANSFNEEQVDQVVDSEFIRAREGGENLDALSRFEPF